MSNFAFLLRDVRAAFRRKDCDGARRVVGEMQRGRLTTAQSKTVVKLLSAVDKCAVRGVGAPPRKPRGPWASDAAQMEDLMRQGFMRSALDRNAREMKKDARRRSTKAYAREVDQTWVRAWDDYYPRKAAWDAAYASALAANGGDHDRAFDAAYDAAGGLVTKPMKPDPRGDRGVGRLGAARIPRGEIADKPTLEKKLTALRREIRKAAAEGGDGQHRNERFKKLHDRLWALTSSSQGFFPEAVPMTDEVHREINAAKEKAAEVYQEQMAVERRRLNEEIREEKRNDPWEMLKRDTFR